MASELTSNTETQTAEMEVMPHFVFTSLSDGRLDGCNARWREYVGLADPGGWVDRLHPDDLGLGDDWAEAVRAGRPFDVECRLRNGAGDYRWFLIRAVPRIDVAGAVASWLATGTDVDDLVKIREELRRSNTALERMAAIAAHDLQEPLRKIQAFGERLALHAGSALDGQARGYLDRMISAAVRMRDLLGGLLSLARVSGGARSITDVDLGVVAREVVGDLEAVIESTGARVQIGPMPVLQAEPIPMRQLLQNLIANALKFHRPGEAPSVRVSARETVEDGPAWVLEVADDGVGFNQSEASRIFEPFQRLHGRGEYPGAGLGLAICREIVERHGGAIAAESIPGRGAVFRVVLPVRPPIRENPGL